MKIIAIDNFDREWKSDFLVAENVSEFYAAQIATALNDKGGDYAEFFYKAVKDDYRLYKWEP